MSYEPMSLGSRLYKCSDCSATWLERWPGNFAPSSLQSANVVDMCEECRERFFEYIRQHVRSRGRWRDEWKEAFNSSN